MHFATSVAILGMLLGTTIALPTPQSSENIQMRADDTVTSGVETLVTGVVNADGDAEDQILSAVGLYDSSSSQKRADDTVTGGVETLATGVVNADGDAKDELLGALGVYNDSE